jgi:trimeric autotransporter adhesin
MRELGNQTMTGYHNTGVGFTALYSITNGIELTGMGHSALEHNTSGSQNSAFGTWALLYNTSGNFNTGIGEDALISNTTAHNNTATGAMALFKNNGNSNTANGYAALYYNTTGFYNVGIGAFALDAITTGSYNTAIGYSADMAGSTFYNSTSIGNGAVAQNSNEMRLGNNSVNLLYCWGAQSPTANAANMYFDGTNGQIMLSTSSLRYKENIIDIVINTNKIYDLRPVTYTSNIDNKIYFGLIAEEVEKILPELVDYAKSKYVIPGSTSEILVPNGVKYPMLSVLMLNEVNKHETRLNNYQDKINELQQQVYELKNQNQKLEEEINLIMQMLKKKRIKS